MPTSATSSSTPDGATPLDQIDEAHRCAEEAKQRDSLFCTCRRGDPLLQWQNAPQGGDPAGATATSCRRRSPTRPTSCRKVVVSPPTRGPNGFHIIVDRQRDGGAQTSTEYHARHILIKPTGIWFQRRGSMPRREARSARRSSPARTSRRPLRKARRTRRLPARRRPRLVQAPPTARVSPTSCSTQLEISAVLRRTPAGTRSLVDIAAAPTSANCSATRPARSLFQRKAEDDTRASCASWCSEAYVEIRLPGGNTLTKAAKGQSVTGRRLPFDPP